MSIPKVTKQYQKISYNPQVQPARPDPGIVIEIVIEIMIESVIKLSTNLRA